MGGGRWGGLGLQPLSLGQEPIFGKILGKNCTTMKEIKCAPSPLDPPVMSVADVGKIYDKQILN